MAKHERESKCKEKQTAKTGVYNAFHQDVHRFSRTAKTRLEHGETNLHGEDKERRQQDPQRVNRINDVVALKFGICGKCFEPQQLGQHRNQTDQQPHPEQLTNQQQPSIAAPLRVLHPGPEA